VGEPLGATGVGRTVMLPTGAVAFVALNVGAGAIAVVVPMKLRLAGIDLGSVRFCVLVPGSTTLALS
jgi:hypothetical protein